MPGEEVDCEGGDNAEPGGGVADDEAEVVPWLGDPAPEHGGTVDFSVGVGFDEEEGEGDDEGYAVAGEVVAPFHSFELLSVVVLEQCQVDVDCHCQVPIGVGRNEHLDEKGLELT